MEIQPLCRYHFRPLKHSENHFFIIDLLPHDGVFDQYALKYVGSASRIKHTWFKPSIDELSKRPVIGSFEEVKSKLQELMVSSFENDFRCEVSYLAAYFK